MTRYEQLIVWLKPIYQGHEFTIDTASADASFRKYYRLTCNQETRIAMDAPPDKEPCDSFIDITKRLTEAAVKVPKIYQYDLKQGFMLLEDLGDRDYLSVLNNHNVDHLYRHAMDSILLMQQKAQTAGLPSYHHNLLQQEMDLFKDYLMDRHLGIAMTKTRQSYWQSLSQCLIKNALSQQQRFVHRDYHSRNLLLNQQHKPAVIDYQDALLGPNTYDLVSLLKDCYVKWPNDKIQSWMKYFFDHSLLSSNLDFEQFTKQFNLMGVHRHLKASGIFCRLYYRDKKSAYLKDIARTLSYVADLDGVYTELTEICAWIVNDIQPILERANSTCVQ